MFFQEASLVQVLRKSHMKLCFFEFVYRAECYMPKINCIKPVKGNSWPLLYDTSKESFCQILNCHCSSYLQGHKLKRNLEKKHYISVGTEVL